MLGIVKEKFVTVGGHRIRYLESGSSKKVLVLVHGLGASADRWSRVIPLFARAFRVVAPDLLGSGYSDRPSLDYTLDFFSGFLNDFFARIGISNLYMIGSSMGGQIAAVHSISNPKNIEKLVLVSPAGFMKRSTVALDAYVMAALYPNRDNATRAFAMMGGSDAHADQDIVDGFVSRMMIHNSKFAFMSALLGLQNSKLAHSDLETISVPTMLVWGANDPVIPLKFADNFTSAIPNCRLHVMEGSGHTPYVHDPDAFVASVLKFFDGDDA